MRKQCHECGASRGIQEFSDGKYCYACHRQFKDKSLIQKPKKEKRIVEMPTEFDELTPEALQYLNKYYITVEDIKRCSIFWSNEYERVCFPYFAQYQGPESNYMIFCWMRSLDKEQKNKWMFIGQKDLRMYWFKAPKKECKECTPNFDFCRCTKSLVIVEDQISAVRVSNHLDCLSLGGTNVHNPLLLKYILEYDLVYVWLDGDLAGRTASQKFIKKYKLYKDIRLIKTDNDPKTYSNKEIRNILSLPIDKT